MSKKMKVSINLILTCCLAMAASNLTPTSGLRILGIFPLNGKSHFVMTERLMRGLAARGHQVDVHSHFPLKKPIPNYTDYPFVGSKMPGVLNNVTYEFIKLLTEMRSIGKILNFTGNHGCELFELPNLQKLIHDRPTNPPYNLVIVEHFLSYCHLVWGRHLNIPMIGISTSMLAKWTKNAMGNPVEQSIEPSIFSKKIPETFYERLKSVLFNAFIDFVFKYYMSAQDVYVEKYFGPGYPSVTDLEKDLSLMLVNHHHSLNGIMSFTPAVIPVGGLHIADNDDPLTENVKKFLDESKDGFIYLSFGSMFRFETLPEPTLRAFYNVFQKIAPIRVLMKIAKPEDLLPGLPSNVITHHWLPQIKVLKHKNIKAFISHGGLMGTLESIYHSVPIIGIPLFGDQHVNVQSYVEKGIAVALDLNELTEENILEAVTTVLHNSTFKQKIKELSDDFKDTPMKPLDTAVYWVEYIARHGKNALRSPLVDMPWWKANMLDVYGFIVGSLLAVAFVLKLVVKKILGLVCRKVCQRSSSKKLKTQ